jgi:hypothetical protein
MSHLPAAARPALLRPAAASLLVVAALTACGGTPSPSARPSVASPSAAVASPSVPPSQPPTPQPTPSYTNPPDPDLVALIPTRASRRCRSPS